jgi:transposase-like protein
VTKKLRGRYREYTKEFRQAAVERMMECENIVKLAEELGMPPRLLYHWRDRHVAKQPTENGHQVSVR